MKMYFLTRTEKGQDNWAFILTHTKNQTFTQQVTVRFDAVITCISEQTLLPA